MVVFLGGSISRVPEGQWKLAGGASHRILTMTNMRPGRGAGKQPPRISTAPSGADAIGRLVPVVLARCARFTTG